MTENKPKKCVQCPYYGIDRKLSYDHFPICMINGKEITFNSENGWDKMKWCPMEGNHDKRTGNDS